MTGPAVAETMPAASARAATRGRVLILRSCRPVQFGAAVRWTRQRHPDAEIVALTHHGHRDTLVAAGVDAILEVPGRRFGLSRLPLSTLWRLRAARFEAIVIPQMTGFGGDHANLYWLAAALRPRGLFVLPGDSDPETLRPGRLWPFLWRQSALALCRRFDPLLLIAVLFVVAVACRPVRRRARVAPPHTAPHGEPERPRRILHVITSFGLGGAQRQLTELVNRTPRDRYALDVLVLGRSDGDFTRGWLARDDVRVTYLKQWPSLIGAVLEIREYCRRGRFDLVHTWLFMANVVGVAGARLAGVPHVIGSVRSLSFGKYTWSSKWWYRPADALASRAADVVSVNATALVADHAAWTRMPAARIAVVHNGLDPSPFAIDRAEARRRLCESLALPVDAMVIGTAGRLAIEKDHRTFLRVMRDVRRRHPAAHGIIIGDGELRADLEAEAAAMGLGGVVTFLGERRDAPSLIAGVDLFLFPSIIEGFANALLEAVLLGVPAVASRAGGNPEVLPDPEALFDVGDERAAVRAVLAALDDPASAAARADRIRLRARDLFTAGRMTANWFALYERCLAERDVA